MSILAKNRHLFLLFFIFILGIFIRLIYFGSTTFFYDQARDAFEAINIWTNDPIKIVGPQTDFKDVFHGTAYWYLISPAYYFSGGNVWAAKFLLVIINCLTIFFIYDLTNSLFKNKKTALLSSFFFAISFEANQYGRWLSNPGPALLTMTISFWSLKKLSEGKSWSLLTLAISWALSIQFQLFLLYQLVIFFVAWVMINGKFIIPKASIKTSLLSLFLFLAFLITYILNEIKFGFRTFHTLLNFTREQTLFGENFLPKFELYFNNLVEVFFLNFWGFNLFFAGLLTIGTFIIVYHTFKENKFKHEILFILTITLSPIFIAGFNSTNAHYTSIGSSIGIIILTAYVLIEYIYKKYNKLIFCFLLLIIIFSNLSLILAKNRFGEVLFTVQDKMLLSDEIKVVDWVYSQSDNKPFSLNTVTAPLFINTTWALLFSWHGQSRYGYMPYWWGEPQVNVPGSFVKFSKSQPEKLHFLIIEPLPSLDTYYLEAIRKLEDSRSEVLAVKEIGNFTVEKRRITRIRSFNNADVFYEVTNLNKNQEKNLSPKTNP